MITEQINDLFDTACWCSAPINDAREVFAEVFSYSEIKRLRKEVRRIATYAFADKLYKKQVPCDVLLDMKVVRSALAAAHALRAASGAEVDGTSVRLVTPLVDYCSGVGKPDHWGDFPRSLSRSEYCNPYRVFAQLFKCRSLQRWVADWESLVEGALSSDNARLQLNAVWVCTGLIKLLEAAHLVWVREGGGGIVAASAGLKVAAAKGPGGAGKVAA